MAQEDRVQQLNGLRARCAGVLGGGVLEGEVGGGGGQRVHSIA